MGQEEHGHEHHNVEIASRPTSASAEHRTPHFHISKKSFWLMASGGIGALALLGLGRATKKIRPTAVGAVREGYAFKEWLAGNFESLKEDVEDIVAEGVHHYEKDLAATADTIKREKEILEKVERIVAERLSKMRPEKEGEV